MRRVCVFPHDPLQRSLAKGEVKTRYFNPGNLFDEVHVISLADTEVDPAAVQELAGDARLFVHPVGQVTLRTLPRLGAIYCRVRERLRAIGPDVIRAYDPFVTGWLAVSCAREMGVPSVVSIHGNFDRDVRELYRLEGRLLRWLKYQLTAATTEPFVLRRATTVITAYEFPVSYVRRYGVREVTVIYNRVDLERFAPTLRVARPGELTVLTVGRLDPGKNHACLIRALAGTEGIRLRIIGDGREAASLARLAGRLGVREQVEFVRAVPHRAIHVEYQRADAFATAIRFGGVSIPVMEAMAAGLPLVVPQPRWEPRPEVVGDAALIVENSPEAFRSAFVRLRDDVAERVRFGQMARGRIEPFGAAVMEERERRMYLTVLGLAPVEASAPLVV